MSTRSILIIQHERAHPPGYLGDFLARAGLTTLTILLRSDRDLPDEGMLAHVAGVVLLDASRGVLAARDGCALDLEMAWIKRVLAAGIPILAQGFGAQLTALASGGEVVAVAPTRGWYPLNTATTPARLQALLPNPVSAFLWRDAAVVPAAGTRALFSDTRRQPLAHLAGNTLLLEFLPHVTPALYAAWLDGWRTECTPPSATAQTIAELDHAAQTHLRQSRLLADALYQYWLTNLARISGTGTNTMA